MATFRVGQRVRINYPDCSHHGCEGTITSGLEEVYFCDISRVAWAYDVKVDGHKGNDFAYEPYELEPLYDGHSKVSWSECLWAPNKETA